MVKVKEFIARVGIKSLDELAEKLELSPATVYSWSQGKRAPT
jgi:DNA-binding transcriptional regulator YiaG